MASYVYVYVARCRKVKSHLYLKGSSSILRQCATCWQHIVYITNAHSLCRQAPVSIWDYKNSFITHILHQVYCRYSVRVQVYSIITALLANSIQAFDQKDSCSRNCFPYSCRVTAWTWWFGEEKYTPLNNTCGHWYRFGAEIVKSRLSKYHEYCKVNTWLTRDTQVSFHISDSGRISAMFLQTDL